MKYETFNPNIHDSRKIATISYDVDFRTYNKLYKSKTKAINAIEIDLKNYDNIKIIKDNGEIIGFIMFYTHDKKKLKFHFKSIKLIIVNIMDYFVLSDIKKGDLYLAEIGIDKNQRSKGYGSKIIHDVIDYACKNNYNRVILDVDFRNTKAKALYEKLGFKVFNKKEFLKRGMYNMEFIISKETLL